MSAGEMEETVVDKLLNEVEVLVPKATHPLEQTDTVVCAVPQNEKENPIGIDMAVMSSPATAGIVVPVPEIDEYVPVLVVNP